jgi:hypothetical protein
MHTHTLPRTRRPLKSLGTSIFSAVVLAMGLSAHQRQAIASDYDVTINTSVLKGDSSTLAFDFIAGGAFSNTVTISDFSTNGTLGVNGPNSGSVAGALPGTVTLSDSSFFNEYLQRITLGSTITFQLDATTKAPTGGALPDTFSFFFLNPTASASLLTTTDPTGADSLFSLQIDGSPAGILGNYSAQPAVSPTIVPVTSSVPEPDTFRLLLFGMLAVVTVRRIGGIGPAATAS